MALIPIEQIRREYADALKADLTRRKLPKLTEPPPRFSKGDLVRVPESSPDYRSWFEGITLGVIDSFSPGGHSGSSTTYAYTLILKNGFEAWFDEKSLVLIKAAFLPIHPEEIRRLIEIEEKMMEDSQTNDR